MLPVITHLVHGYWGSATSVVFLGQVQVDQKAQKSPSPWRLHQLCALTILVLTILPFTEPFRIFDPNSVADATVEPLRNDERGATVGDPNSVEWIRPRVSVGLLPAALAITVAILQTGHGTLAA